jgi:hypothetical protein
MLDAVVLTAWSSFTVCVVWFFGFAKRSAPIAADDVKVMWAIHRKNAHCSGHKWQPIKQRKGKIVGFQCECGYKYTQKRPLISRIPKRSEHPASFFFRVSR